MTDIASTAEARAQKTIGAPPEFHVVSQSAFGSFLCTQLCSSSRYMVGRNFLEPQGSLSVGSAQLPWV